MTASAVAFRSDAIGRWSEPDTFEVTRERIAAYAAATNDPIEAHRSGDVAPPVFAVMKPPAAMMRSNALRLTTRSLITGNARDRHGSM